MSNARSDIYANIRRSLGVTGQEATRRGIVRDRLGQAPKGILPARGQVSGEERIALFKTMVEAAFATLAEVRSHAEVPHVIAEYLRNHNLPAAVRIGDDGRLSDMPWADTSLQITRGRSEGGDLNAVSHAFGAVAETGTIAMVSGPDNPSTLNFLPDNHIVVVQAEDVHGDYETLWSRVREAYGKGVMPRTVNWITGPSRSADIEQTLLLGAHGPRRLHVVLVRD